MNWSLRPAPNCSAYGVDGNYQVKATTLQPVSIPLGTTAVAQATKNVQFQGTLPPTGDVANTAEIIQSAILGDSRYAAPPAGATAGVAVPPIVTTTTATDSGAAGPLIPGGTYDYRVVFVDANGNESDAATFTGTIPASAATNEGMTIANLPTDASGKYVGRRVYRTQELGTAGANPVYYLDKDLSSDNTTTSFTDTTDDATLATQTQQDTSTISGNYSYYVTFVKPGVPESHPSPLIGPQNVTNDRIVVSNLPTPTGQYAGGKRSHLSQSGHESVGVLSRGRRRPRPIVCRSMSPTRRSPTIRSRTSSSSISTARGSRPTRRWSICKASTARTTLSRFKPARWHSRDKKGAARSPSRI